MATFLTGDELGNIKRISCSRSSETDWKLEDTILHTPAELTGVLSGKSDVRHVHDVGKQPVQKLSLFDCGRKQLVRLHFLYPLCREDAQLNLKGSLLQHIPAPM
jgi:hypothetical protein